MVRFRSTKDLFKRTQRMVEDGGMPRPRWLDPFLECATFWPLCRS